MTDTAAQDFDDQGPEAPEAPDADACEALQAAILHNVELGLADPLLGLSDQTELDLVRLAYHDTMRLERLERVIRAAIRDRNDGEGAAKAFNLSTYRRAAAQTRRKIQEEQARRAKMRQRNLRVISGGQEQSNTDVEVPGGTPMSVHAMVEASSVFLRAAGLLMMFRKGRLWYDEFYGDYFTDWAGKEDDTVIPVAKIDDAWMLCAHGYLLMLDTKLAAASFSNTERVIHFVADQDRRNEPREWMRGLVWDKAPRLAYVLHKAYGSNVDAYHEAVGRCWFISMAARINEPGCKVDTMPVLFGPQGTSKSTSLEVIGGKWYATINTTADSKDFLDALRGLLVAEVAELDAISGNRVENSRVKTLLSTRVDRYRPPYGRTSRDFRRTAVLVGTTNDPGWHRDETGGRRFWPVHCAGDIDLAWLRENREQLFAEAQARYVAGEAWWDVPRGDQEAAILAHYSADPWEDRLASWLASTAVYRGAGSVVEPIAGDQSEAEEGKHWGTLVTTNRLATVALGLPTERQNRNTSNRIARAMRSSGWDHHLARVKSGDKSAVVRCWAVTQPSGDEETKNEGKLL